MSCPNAQQCPLFCKFCSDSTLSFWKSMYCESPTRFSSCARFELRKAGGKPGPFMLPNGKELPHKC